MPSTTFYHVYTVVRVARVIQIFLLSCCLLPLLSSLSRETTPKCKSGGYSIFLQEAHMELCVSYAVGWLRLWFSFWLMHGAAYHIDVVRKYVHVLLVCMLWNWPICRLEMSVFVCSCAAYHKHVSSFGGACLVKMTHLLAGHAHMCFCCMFKCVCVCVCVCVFVSVDHTAKVLIFLCVCVCVVKWTHL